MSQSCGALLQGSTQALALMKVAGGGERWLQSREKEVYLFVRGEGYFGNLTDVRQRDINL